MGKVVGPGTVIEQSSDRHSTLDGASELEYVKIKNILTDDFAIRVAQDVAVNMPFEIRDKTSLVQNEGDITRNYGLGLKNSDFQGRKHITNDIVIPAGETINLKGSEAQVAVRQIVNELMQREGNTRKLSDPELRHEAESRIIVARGNIQDLMDAAMQSERQQMNAALEKSNEGLQHGQSEQAVKETTAEKRKPGRPKQNIGAETAGVSTGN